MKNWKLQEINGLYSIVNDNSISYRNNLLEKLNVPVCYENETGLHRSDTLIDWYRMPRYYKFFFDNQNLEEKIHRSLKSSRLLEKENVIIIYGWEEPAIMVPTSLFFEDWEGFIRSTFWETIIFSEDKDILMEVSRDYYLHSNFEIMPDSKIL
jgi:hypothetical protein